MADADDLVRFFWNAGSIMKETRFAIDSIPNVDRAAIERLLHQLDAVLSIVLQLTADEITGQDELDKMISDTANCIITLDSFLEQPHRDMIIERELVYSGLPGAPRYKLNLDRATTLHALGNSWEDVAKAMGVDRRTLSRHFERIGLTTKRPSFTPISDEELDEVVSEISLEHPFIGSSIMAGHLESREIHIPMKRVQDSLRRVDSIGVLIRCEFMAIYSDAIIDNFELISWAGLIKRRVYHVRGANALWHHDGNEKLKPWGFYVHGCVDGHSRLILYLECCNNKRSATVEELFMSAVGVYGWPSRVRGDFGTENNGVERRMNARRGAGHHAYLRGRCAYS
jgi:hypothetical protein